MYITYKAKKKGAQNERLNNYYYCPLNMTRFSQHAENGVLGDFLVATSPYC